MAASVSKYGSSNGNQQQRAHVYITAPHRKRMCIITSYHVNNNAVMAKHVTARLTAISISGSAVAAYRERRISHQRASAIGIESIIENQHHQQRSVSALSAGEAYRR